MSIKSVTWLNARLVSKSQSNVFMGISAIQLSRSVTTS